MSEPAGPAGLPCDPCSPWGSPGNGSWAGGLHHLQPCLLPCVAPAQLPVGSVVLSTGGAPPGHAAPPRVAPVLQPRPEERLGHLVPITPSPCLFCLSVLAVVPGISSPPPPPPKELLFILQSPDEQGPHCAAGPTSESAASLRGHFLGAHSTRGRAGACQGPGWAP